MSNSQPKNNKPTQIVIEHGFTKETFKPSDSSKPFKSRYWLQIILAIIVLIIDFSSQIFIDSNLLKAQATTS